MMGRRDEGWALSDKIRFGEILVRAGVLERSLLENLVRERDATGMDLGELLVARGIIDEATMLQTIGKSLNRPVVGLDAARSHGAPPRVPVCRPNAFAAGPPAPLGACRDCAPGHQRPRAI